MWFTFSFLQSLSRGMAVPHPRGLCSRMRLSDCPSAKAAMAVDSERRPNRVWRRWGPVDVLRGTGRGWSLALLAGAFALSAGWCNALAESPLLTLTNPAGSIQSFTLSELSALPTITLRAANEHQATADYTGVELHQLLAATGIAQGKELRGKHLSEYAVVSARDGYRVVFALPELDPVFADRKVVLAWRKDNQPLPEAEGPLRVIVPGEKHPTRWIRQVTSIRILAAPDSR